MGKKRQIKEKLLPPTAATQHEQGGLLDCEQDNHLSPKREEAVTPSPVSQGQTVLLARKIPATTSPVPSNGSSHRLTFAATLIGFSSFLWGYGLAVLNVCIVPDAVGSILVDINLSTEEQETATALMLVGALLSALTTGRIGQRIGHKTTILLNNIMFIIGGVVCALAMSKKAIFIGRFCIGIACGIVTNTVPILLNEISPVAVRGRITTFHQLLLTIGILMTGILGFFVVANVPSGWRYLNACIIIPSVLQLVLMRWIPESPFWLMKNKCKRESRTVLLYLRSETDRDKIEAELVEIARTMETDTSAASTGAWSDLWEYKSVIIMGTLMVLFQAMTGINTVMLYSAKIFHFAGVTNPFLATAVVGMINVLVTVVSVSFVDSYGRRPLLLNGTVLMIVSLITLSLSLLYLNDNIKLQGIVAVGSVLLFVSGFAVGLGAVVWVVLADITPIEIRSRAFSLFMGVSYICNIFIAVYTLSAINFLGTGTSPEKNGIAKLYLILGSVAIVAWLYMYAKIPDQEYAVKRATNNTSMVGRTTPPPKPNASNSTAVTMEERHTLLPSGGEFHRGHTTEL